MKLRNTEVGDLALGSTFFYGLKTWEFMFAIYSKVWPIIPLRIRMRLQIFGSEFTYHVSPSGDAT